MASKLTRRRVVSGLAAGSIAGLSGYWVLRARRTVPVPAHGVSSASPNATSVTAAAATTSTPTSAPELSPDYNPPARTGIRGDHDGSFDFAHRLRDGAQWSDLGEQEDTGEHYDLVVIGSGISGLSAAYFYRQRFGAGARVLILEAHDDFGGHASRNEFSIGGRLLLSYGGSQSLASPSTFSDVAKRLMADLGVKMSAFDRAFDQRLYANLGTGLFFDRESYGTDRLLTGMYRTPWPEFLANAPLQEDVRQDLIRIYTDKRDYLAGSSVQQKIERLRWISYADYLTKDCSLSSAALRFFQTHSHDLFGVGIDGVSAWSCFHGVDDFGAFHYPGFEGLGLPPPEPSEPYIHHFPDGNASIARLLVRSLNPAALPGNTMDDVILAQVAYAKLDDAESRVRIRLNSGAIHARHMDAAANGPGVEVVYWRAGKARKVSAKHGIFACPSAMVPYLLPELPAAQKQALSYLVRMPLVYTHVAVQNWKAFANLGVRQIVSPGAYHNYTALDFPVSMGGYQFPSDPSEPAVLFMLRVPCRPGLPRREQNRAGRWELMNTTLENYEQRIRDQLDRMLAGTGFDAARDVRAITVNRWAHGYSFIPNRLFDPKWQDDEKPWIVGRKPHGRFAIANADAGASAYLDVAVDQAHRAVNELT
jgi:spermidine dehydrogenase